MVAAETDQLAWHLSWQLVPDELDDLGALGPAIDVVAHQDQGVLSVQLRELRQRLLQRREVAVNIADREGAVRHARGV